MNNYQLKSIGLENFKSYSEKQTIIISDLSILMGANSSGKSSALQAVLAIKQTMECNSPAVDLLLSGKYVALGECEDVLNNKDRSDFCFSLSFLGNNIIEENEREGEYSIKWTFGKSEETTQAKLMNVFIEYGNDTVSFKRVDNGHFQTYVNGKETAIHSIIRNLHFDEVYLTFDKDFNELFVSFMNEINGLVYHQKPQMFKKDIFVSSGILPRFYIDLLKKNSMFLFESNSYSHSQKKLAKQLVELIEKYCEYQNPYMNEFLGIPKELREATLVSLVRDNKKAKPVQDLINKYQIKFDDYINNTTVKISDYLGKERLNMYNGNWFGSLKADGKDSRDSRVLSLVTDFYAHFENDIIGKLFFLGPIREKPKALYNIGFETIPKYVGQTGSNFATVLLHENNKKKYILPDGNTEELTLLEALDEWAKHLNIASAVNVQHGNSFGVNVRIFNTQNKESDIMNVGIGTSQVLPVLITGLLSEENETLVFEQPELHLHPYSQSRLADFFVELVRGGRKVIVETHSEAFILRLRFHLIKGDCPIEKLAINFFKNENGTKVETCALSEYGTIDYPDDFRDETQELLNNLIDASSQRMVGK